MSNEDDNWVRDFARFQGISEETVQELFHLFLGNRALDWPNPFGNPIVDIQKWDNPADKNSRMDQILSKGWTWRGCGIGILQNEVYRHTTESQANYQSLAEYLRRWMKDHPRPGFRFLDYGCGTANFVEFLLKQYPEWPIYFDLTDVDTRIIDYCRTKFRNWQDRVACRAIPCRSKVNASGCRIRTRRTAFSGRFGVIYAMDVLEHTLNPLHVLVRFCQALEDGGLLILVFPDSIEGDWHTPEANYQRA